MAARLMEKELQKQLVVTLAELFGVSEKAMEVRTGDDVGVDLLVRVANRLFAAVLLAVAAPGRLADQARNVAAATRRIRGSAIPLVAVPFMPPSGRQICERANVAWLDFSGNMRIFAPGMQIAITGEPNRFRPRGRPASAFAPKSARVVRWLLMHPKQAHTQREIARATRMGEGFVSRIVSRLEQDGYLLRDPSGALLAKDPQLLLDTWRDEYSFEKHTLIPGHVAARSGDALTRFVSDTLSAVSVEHAATGLAAAWQMTHFAAFRIATFFVPAHSLPDLKERLRFREEPRGANLWLVVPNDDGVFQGAHNQAGVRCVHPVQAYVDLKSHPERAPEAAEHLRAERLT